jgi:hypothetical protein
MPGNVSGYRSLPAAEQEERRVSRTHEIHNILKNTTDSDNDWIKLGVGRREDQAQWLGPSLVQAYRDGLRLGELDPEDRKALREDIAQTLEDWHHAVPGDIRRAAAAALRAPSPTPS